MENTTGGIYIELKKVARSVKWSIQYAYDKTISRKAFRIRKFDKIVRKNPVRFTIWANRDGVTDQLAVFRFFYKVGRSLGLSYCYTPVYSERSVPIDSDISEHSEDVLEQIGFKQILRELHDEQCNAEEEIVTFDLDRVKFTRRVIDSYDTVLMEIKSLLSDRITSKKPVTVRFKGSPSVFWLYRLSVENRKSDPQLLKYLPKKVSDWETDNKIRMLIHIRQGDTAIIRTPWNPAIPIWYANPGSYREHGENDMLDDSENIDPDEYLSFLKALFSEIDESEVSTRLFSDGYRRAFRLIEKHPSLNFTDHQQSELKQLEENIDEDKFKGFYQFRNCRVSIGEDTDKLEQLIRSFLECDLVVTGTQAKLIPKLTTLFRYGEMMPVMVLLYREKRPHIDYLGLPEDDERVIFADLENLNIPEIAERIRRLTS